jgi:hypothetical protein
VRRDPRGRAAGGGGGLNLEPPIPPREAIADVRLRAPTRGNRRLESLLEAVNADDQVKAWWHVSAVNATRRLGMSDHSWVVNFVSSSGPGRSLAGTCLAPDRHRETKGDA